MPRNYITRDGFNITGEARDYLAPLIMGEAYPQYRNGMPQYVRLKNIPVPRKLKTNFKV
jgi:6-phosphofructokinase 1